ncbi:MAG: Kazal-type serine protease inhibitor domain-containing protein [Rhizobiaceae bacterium]
MQWLSRVGAFLVLGATLFVAGCMVDAGPPPGPPAGPQYCTREYAPVCARRHGERQTFPNACEAEMAGFRNMRPGECRYGGGGGGGWDGGGNGWDGGPPGPQYCTREYAPVCARRRGDVQTFSNACEADAAGYRIITDGPC